MDVVTDIAAFVEPAAVRLLPSPWAQDCHLSLTTFFSAVLAAIGAGDQAVVRRLLGHYVSPPMKRTWGSRSDRRAGTAWAPGEGAIWRMHSAAVWRRSPASYATSRTAL